MRKVTEPQTPTGIETDSPITQDRDNVSLAFLFWTFLKIGSVAFGGFMALISVVETIIVQRHKLLQHKEMLDGISLANLLPGPMAVNVVAFVGYRLRGPLGALVSATAVILPSFFLLLALSYLYFNYGQVPGVQKAFQGFIPAVAAIVLSVVWRMGQKTITGLPELVLAAIAATVMFLTPNEYKVYAPITLIALFALIGHRLFINKVGDNAGSETPGRPVSLKKLGITLALLGSLVALWFVPLPLERDSLLLLTLTFASMSLILFGGGFVFIPIIGSIVVLDYSWVTQQEFTDGIAMGQITPGPILISATFIGYKVADFTGALLATIAIFTPPAILMVTASQALDFIQRSRVTRAAMRGIHCGVIGMILVAAYVILKPALPTAELDVASIWPTALIFIASLIALLRFKLDVVWIIPAAGLFGYLFY
ncbi:MAG: chromate efflux transporter [Thiohalophilus sp.]|uniref:chromate efflux transporter n=1 Tax=Thiohalophilus sp. TaxID=3028392 RepID=UPI0028700F25|nr:chromate efflux transporter [Thiohalophilus sp.]MDR9436230.1 chromate efflux transporter [Thiohalophilus sp.]